jgi:UbiD family decarboxylase
MAYTSLRDWIKKIEEFGQLKHVTAEVDWDQEIGAIARRMARDEGPALLFENIKGYQNKACRKLFINSMGSRERVALSLGLPLATPYRGIVEFIKERFGQRIPPVIVKSGPVKQNIVKGAAVDLFHFPAPKYNHLDPGRYINTYVGVITMDPDTKIMNVGMYRGMIGDNEKSIAVFLNRSQHWGLHFTKYEKRRQEMPVAVVYGWDPILFMCAGSPVVHPGYSEYDLMGALRGEPVELVKCETSDLYVPASAEIVVEGFISSDPKTFQMEGPFGEYPGFYGGVGQRRPVIRVECITHRNDPIFQAGITGTSPGHIAESTYWAAPMRSASIWKNLEDAGVPNIVGVWGPLVTCLVNLRIQIDKLYRGHAKQVAAALWASSGSAEIGKNLIVVDKDIDVYDDHAFEWALAYRVNADMGAVQFFKGTIGSSLDPSVPLAQRDPIKYGQGKWTRMFIDATVNWDLEPEERYGGRREPPLCTETLPEMAEQITRRWQEYGL